MTQAKPIVLVASAAALVLVPGEAHAYLDPGTGSMIFQAAMASIFAGMFALKTYWHRIKTFFSSKPAGKELEADRAQAEEKN